MQQAIDKSHMMYYNIFSNTKYRGETMEDRFLQQLKKGVLEMLVLRLILFGALLAVCILNLYVLYT